METKDFETTYESPSSESFEIVLETRLLDGTVIDQPGIGGPGEIGIEE